MNVTQKQIDSFILALRKMGATRVLLFGSYAVDPSSARDIDLAVEGIPLRRLLEADVVVHEILQVPTDLTSKEENPTFFLLIEESSRTLYDKARIGRVNRV